MAVCPICNKKFSDTVIVHHIKRCAVEEVEVKEVKEVEETDEEIRVKAKGLGIKSWHVKKIDKLKKEIEEVI